MNTHSIADGANQALPARVVLGVLSAGFLVVHGFVVFVAIAVSGDELLLMWDAYLAMGIPMVFPLYGLACAFGRVSGRNLKRSGILPGLSLVLALFYSFLGLGWLLPLLLLPWLWLCRVQVG